VKDKNRPTEGIFFCFLFLIAWVRYGNLKQKIRLKTTVSKHQTLYFFRFWLSSFLFILCSLLHLSLLRILLPVPEKYFY